MDDEVLEMPKFALANLMWVGRERPLMQTASLGLRMLLGGGRACYRKLFLGKRLERRVAIWLGWESRARESGEAYEDTNIASHCRSSQRKFRGRLLQKHR